MLELIYFEKKYGKKLPLTMFIMKGMLILYALA